MRTLSRVFEVTSRGERKSEKSRLDYAKETTLFFPSLPLLMARIAFYGKSLATEYPEQLSQSNILPWSFSACSLSVSGIPFHFLDATVSFPLAILHVSPLLLLSRLMCLAFHVFVRVEFFTNAISVYLFTRKIFYFNVIKENSL